MKINQTLLSLLFITVILAGCGNNTSEKKIPKENLIEETTTPEQVEVYKPVLRGDRIDNLVEIGRIYKRYSSRLLDDGQIYRDLQDMRIPGMEKTCDFITEAITKENNINQDYFLQKPDDTTMLNLYIITKVLQNQGSEKNTLDKDLVTEILNKTEDNRLLLSNYYGLLFKGITNKNRPFAYNNFNYQLDSLNLTTPTEKGIFVLNLTSAMVGTIHGYIKTVSPPNTHLALETIQNFPTIDGKPYFYYNDFDFEDFKADGLNMSGKFKRFYIDNFIELLAQNLFTLTSEKVDIKTAHAIVDSSIITDRNYWKFYHDKETLEQNFGK